jgi:hypothetical protein
LTNTAISSRFKIFTDINFITPILVATSDISIYSFQKNIIINNKTNDQGRLQVFDMFGRLLLARIIDSNTNQTVATNFEKGSYLVEFKYFNKSIIKKLVLIN